MKKAMVIFLACSLSLSCLASSSSAFLDDPKTNQLVVDEFSSSCELESFIFESSKNAENVILFVENTDHYLASNLSDEDGNQFDFLLTENWEFCLNKNYDYSNKYITRKFELHDFSRSIFSPPLHTIETTLKNIEQEEFNAFLRREHPRINAFIS